MPFSPDKPSPFRQPAPDSKDLDKIKGEFDEIARKHSETGSDRSKDTVPPGILDTNRIRIDAEYNKRTGKKNPAKKSSGHNSGAGKTFVGIAGAKMEENERKMDELLGL